jgi:hypothetical protein
MRGFAELFWLTENAFLLTTKQEREETGERERRE